MSVFHLKYRPNKISELDLTDVSDKLTKILGSKDMPQSWLFAGPKGSGKTSAARILAKSINCLDPDGVEPCDKCKNCQEIMRGNSLDIIEIDGASNRGVDDIRNLKDSAYLSPINLKKKVVIIDEVHMLTREAFNALLKVLEEPPKNLIFVLCTTDDNKIPETVLSRLCQIRFIKGNKESLKKSLNKIIKGEKIKIDEDAINYILEKSDGSFRNLQRNFNEIFLQTGKKISLKDIEGYLLKNGEYEGKNLEEDLMAGEVEVILEKLEKMAGDGVNFADLREKWLQYFQAKMLSFYGLGTKSDGLDLISIKKIIDLLIEAGGREKLTEIGQLPLEMVIVDFLGKKSTLSTEHRAPSTEDREQKKEKERENMVTGEVAEIANKWGEVLMAVKPFNHSVEAFLRAARPYSMKNGVLTLEVFYKFHKERLEEAKNRQIVMVGLEKVLGKGVEFKCVLIENKKNNFQIDNFSLKGLSSVATSSNEQIPKTEKKAEEIFV
ncbi:DNA polymerase III, subunit gamma and tau [Candidatus Shapirobacteria bacterium CG2_30_35_20]|uniref:DNA polymerase III subunit gamma/tau n=1 Tax=Candidatus Shapirobacteria bacterium CG2_30_35_20 TaxID=1805376 RepID=A0A1J5I0W4_9BACT|nr:MAG: DNA polymerase III, subunit gamma and tau [Candidatus Shapirobacteria bacterium CG2_30_35_20]